MDKVPIQRILDQYNKTEDVSLLQQAYSSLEKLTPPSDALEKFEWLNNMAGFYRQIASAFAEHVGNLPKNESLYELLGTTKESLDESCDFIQIDDFSSKDYDSQLGRLNQIGLDQIPDGNPLVLMIKSYREISESMLNYSKNIEEKLDEAKERIHPLEDKLNNINLFK